MPVLIEFPELAIKDRKKIYGKYGLAFGWIIIYPETLEKNPLPSSFRLLIKFTFLCLQN